MDNGNGEMVVLERLKLCRVPRGVYLAIAIKVQATVWRVVRYRVRPCIQPRKDPQLRREGSRDQHQPPSSGRLAAPFPLVALSEYQ